MISDNSDTQMGLRLSGVEGVIVHDREGLVTAMEQARYDPEIAVILVTQKLVALAHDYVYGLKASAGLPLIVEIPDRHSAGTGWSVMSKYISEAIGVEL